MPTRREILQSGFGLAVASAVPAKLFADNSQTPLKQLAAHSGIAMGAQSMRSLLQDKNLASFIAQNFSVLTPGIELKWERIHPAPQTYFFADGDWMVNFAQGNGMKVHGHNLCWNDYNPSWMAKTINKNNAEQILTDHITKVVSHYRGRIPSWDVVNEPVRSQLGRPDGLSTGLWLNTLGPRYIDIAFAAAHAADPDAKLIMNLDSLEQDTGTQSQNRQHALTLIQQMLQRKVPIHGIGSESHLDGNSNAKSADAARFYQAVHALGLSVALSELDINDSWENGDGPTRKAKNGRVYADFITWVASAVPLSRISFWTVSDTRNWLDGAAQNSASFRRKDGEAHAPGLLSAADAPNPAWSSVRAAIAALPQRS